MKHLGSSYSYPITFSLSSLFYLSRKEKTEQEGIHYSSESCHKMRNRLSSFSFPKMIRQYTFTCEQDFIDINEGFCPKYAVYWLDEQNRLHWPEGTVIRHRPEYLQKKEEYMKIRKTGEDSRSISPLSDLSDSINSENEYSLKNVHFDIFNEIIPIFDEYSY